MVKKLADAARKAAAHKAEKKAARDELKRAVKGAVEDTVRAAVERRAPEGLRERKKSRTYQAIVKAAVELFEEKGFEATTVEEIAEAADISPRTFFRYFDSKVDVVMPGGDHDHYPEKGETPFADLLASRPPGESPVEAVRQSFLVELQTMLNETPLAVRQLRVTMTTPSLRTRVFEHFQEHQAEMAVAFATRLGVDEDELLPHLVASAVGTTMWTVVDRWIAEGAREERLLPLFNEAFTLLATGFDALPPQASS